MSLVVYIFFYSEPYPGRSKESNNRGIKVQVKRTFKTYSFLPQNKNKNKDKQKKNRQVPLEIFLNPECSGSTKWQTKIVTYYPSALKVLSCKLCNNKYMITSTQIVNTEIFAFIAVLVFKLLNRKVLFINRQDNRNC